jgi:hypothetical protein
MGGSDDALPSALREEGERVAPGGMIAYALDERRGVGRHHIGLGKRDAVHRRDDDRRRQRREGQVSRAEALAAQVRATVGE